ncbi:hypothetical protein [Sulfurimonas sp.]
MYFGSSILIAGNQDKFLRPLLPIFLGDRLQIENELVYEDLNAKKYLVTHGDFFDSVTMTKKWLVVLGDYGYDFLLHLNPIVNFLRRTFGVKKYWSLSQYVKDNVKKSVSFIDDYEKILSE